MREWISAVLERWNAHQYCSTELYDEVFEILDSLTFFQKRINPIMWPVFEATYHTFKSDAADYVHGTRSSSTRFPALD